MKNIRSLIAVAVMAVTAAPAFAQDSLGAAAMAMTPTYNANWMSSEVKDAWAKGYTGQNVRITVVDDHTSKSGTFQGRLLNDTRVFNVHGGWTSLEAQMVAPGAEVVKHQFVSGTAVALDPVKLDVINASYGMMGLAGKSLSTVSFGNTERSIIDAARAGTAVVVKAAGNDGVIMNTKTAAGKQDYLAGALTGAQSAIFVGALNKNGTPEAKATIETYSNRAGTDVNVQKQFLVVGVARSYTQLSGTSFAAPIVSGYAAVLGSKFTTATPTQIANQLLTTARTDTINGYNVAVHGRGEASLTRALAPVAIK